jgi:hypothetical protein
MRIDSSALAVDSQMHIGSPVTIERPS